MAAPDATAGFVAARERAPMPLGGLATVAFLGLTAGVQMSDRGLQAILSPATKQAFVVGDAVMGALHGIAGVLVASALATPLARLGDRHSRKRVLLGLIAAWTLLTMLGALAPNFALFFAGRAASGITEFAMIPIVYSLIPDLVGDRWRVGSNLAFAALMAIGASAGFYLGGDLLRFAETVTLPPAWPPLDAWRIAMLLLALAGLPLLLLGLWTQDSARSTPAASQGEAPASLIAFVRSRWRPTLLFVGAAGGLAVAVQAVTPMISMALNRRLAMDLATVGHAMGLITLVTSLGSLLVAGLVDRALRGRWGEGARPAIMGLAAALSVPCLVGLAFASGEQQALWLVGGFLLATCVANALIPTILQDLAPVNLRARCFAAYSFLIAGFCALGPLLSGAISQFAVSDDLLLAIVLTGVPVLCVAVACAAAAWRVSGHNRS